MRDTDQPTGFPEPPAEFEPGNHSGDEEPHHTLNTPVGEPEPDEDVEADAQPATDDD